MQATRTYEILADRLSRRTDMPVWRLLALLLGAWTTLGCGSAAGTYARGNLTLAARGIL